MPDSYYKVDAWKYEEEARVFEELSECLFQNGLFFEPVGGQIHVVGIVLAAGSHCEENRCQRQSVGRSQSACQRADPGRGWGRNQTGTGRMRCGRTG
jgi:hypothetical protein